MSDFLALGGTIAVWLAVSIALWLARRLWIRSRQNKRLGHAAAAVEVTRGANGVFDAIRAPSPPEDAPEDARAYLLSETHALLNRIQQQGDYFDRVNGLRVTIQAALGVENHKGLSDILDLRRDLWAASEIVLVEDPAQFGRTFADEGAFERFRGEAVRTLFKLLELSESGEDVIDLRIALAIQEAESFAADLSEAVAAARERDRLPTPAELAAYPVAWVRKIPPTLAAIAAFAGAFYAHASEASRRVRGSEAVTRGAARMRQIGEDWPQRLSDGFQRANEAARENTAALRQHYDFLAAAHDFKGKYQTLIQRAPELSDRSRQFIARLELVERSERLRLTSANAAIWAARKAVDGLAHTLAFLRNTHATMRETAPYALASAALAPAPVRGRRVPAFRSYRRALGANGLREPIARPVILIEPAPESLAKKRTEKAAAAPAKKKTATAQKPRKVAIKRAAASEKPKLAEPPAKVARAAKPEAEKTSAVAESKRAATKKPSGECGGFFGFFAGSGKAKEAVAKSDRAAVKIKPQPQEKPAARPGPAPAAPAAASIPSPKIQPDVGATALKAKAAKPKPHREPPKSEAPPVEIAVTTEPLEAESPPTHFIAKTEPLKRESVTAAPELPELAGKPKADAKENGSLTTPLPQDDNTEKSPAAARPESIADKPSRIAAAVAISESAPAGKASKRGSFLGRLFARGKSSDGPDNLPSTEHLQHAIPYEEADHGDDAIIDALAFEDPIEPPPSLRDKLSSLEESDDLKVFDEAIDADEGAEIELVTSKNEPAEYDAEDFGPLTQSLMELQVNMKPQTPQIKAFPWLRQ